MRRTADAVVVGGGIHGCSVAYNLASHGLRVVLVERHYLASGATGRSAAGIRHQFGTEVNIKLAAASVRLFERLRDDLAYRPSIDLVQRGYLMLAYTHTQLEQFKANQTLQRRLDPGNTTVILTPEEIHELNPFLNLEGVVGASFNPRDGHVNPWHATQAYADAARRLGAEIHTSTELTGIRVKHGRVLSAVTSKGEISTPIIVNCAGPHGNVVSEMAGVSIPLIAQRHQILVTEPVGEICPMMVISFSHGTYFKQTPHGSFLLGYGDPEHENIGFDQSATWQFLVTVARKIAFHIPVLRRVRVVRQWAGLYDMTPDSQAIVGPVPEPQGLYLDVGWSGHGLQLGPVIGQVLAELIVEGKPSIDIHPLRYTRFSEGDLCPEPACV